MRPAATAARRDLACNISALVWYVRAVKTARSKNEAPLASAVAPWRAHGTLAESRTAQSPARHGERFDRARRTRLVYASQRRLFRFVSDRQTRAGATRAQGARFAPEGALEH